MLWSAIFFFPFRNICQTIVLSLFIMRDKVPTANTLWPIIKFALLKLLPFARQRLGDVTFGLLSFVCVHFQCRLCNFAFTRFLLLHFKNQKFLLDNCVLQCEYICFVWVFFMFYCSSQMHIRGNQIECVLSLPVRRILFKFRTSAKQTTTTTTAEEQTTPKKRFVIYIYIH